MVDNGSTDGTPEQLAAYPALRVLALPSNLGFVRGNNAGIAAAPAGNDIVLLNNDLEFPRRDWLQRLRRAAHSAPDVGIVGCRQVLSDGRLLHAGTYILPDTMWGQQIGALERNVGQFTRPPRGRGDHLRGGLPEARRDRRHRRARGGLRVVLRGHRLLPARREGGVPHALCGRFRGRPRRARLDRRRRQPPGWRSSSAAGRSSAASGSSELDGRYRRDLVWQSILNFPTGYARSSRAYLHELDHHLGVRCVYRYVYGKGSPFQVEEPENTGDYYLNVVRGRELPRGHATSGRLGRLRPGRRLPSRHRQGEGRIHDARSRRFPARLGRAGERDGRDLGAFGVQSPGVPRLRPEAPDSPHSARRRHRVLPSRRAAAGEPDRRVRLPGQLRVGRAQGSLAPPARLQRDLPRRRAGAAAVQDQQPRSAPQAEERDPQPRAQAAGRQDLVPAESRLPARRAADALPLGRLLPRRVARRGLGHAADGGDGLRPADDRLRLELAHRVRPRRDLLPPGGRGDRAGGREVPLLRRLPLGAGRRGATCGRSCATSSSIRTKRAPRAPPRRARWPRNGPGATPPRRSRPASRRSRREAPRGRSERRGAPRDRRRPAPALQFPLHRYAPDGDCAVTGLRRLGDPRRRSPASSSPPASVTARSPATSRRRRAFFVGPGRAALALEILAVGCRADFRLVARAARAHRLERRAPRRRRGCWPSSSCPRRRWSTGGSAGPTATPRASSRRPWCSGPEPGSGGAAGTRLFSRWVSHADSASGCRC